MSRLLVFGPGYTASRIATATEAMGWTCTRIGRHGFDRAEPAIAAATHIVSSIPPHDAGDPVLRRYRSELAQSGAWLGYLSSTGVYGDTDGAWVDESAVTGHGRRSARSQADAKWLALGARVFRLPGIYGPGRSPLERIASGTAYRVNLPRQMFSRVHVDDIVTGVLAALYAPAGAYNLADDEPAAQDEVMAYAATLLGAELPPLIEVDQLPPAARAFYGESRRVANGKAARVLGWHPCFRTYREGLRDLRARMSPVSVSAPPSPAASDQR
jgi:nucleoside-diphosphate-sugar epimerase